MTDDGATTHDDADPGIYRRLSLNGVSSKENNIQELTYDEHCTSARRNFSKFLDDAGFNYILKHGYRCMTSSLSLLSSSWSSSASSSASCCPRFGPLLHFFGKTYKTPHRTSDVPNSIAFPSSHRRANPQIEKKRPGLKMPSGPRFVRSGRPPLLGGGVRSRVVCMCARWSLFLALCGNDTAGVRGRQPPRDGGGSFTLPTVMGRLS